MLSDLHYRLRGIFRKKMIEDELDAEVRFHIERQTEKYIQAGLPREEATRRSRLEFGGLDQVKDECRKARGISIFEEVRQDVRYAVRQLRRTPVLTIVITLSLALGIGANTAIFAAIDAVLLRMLPVKQPQELVMLEWSAQEYPGNFVSDMLGGGVFATGRKMRAFSYPTFEQLRDQNDVFSSMLAVAGNDAAVNVGLNGNAEAALMQAVSGNYFEALGVPAILGRTLTPIDDQKSAQPVAVLSYSFWTRRMGQDSSVVGRAITINATPIEVIGVTPEKFSGLNAAASPDIWIPLSVYTAQTAFASVGGRSQTGETTTANPYWERPKTWWLGIIGRLKPGTTAIEARSELTILYNQSLSISCSSRSVQG